MKHNYQARTNSVHELLEPGDYVLRVESAVAGFSTGSKTRGAEELVVTFSVQGHPDASVKAWLTDHASTAWVIDTFCTCFNVNVSVGEDVDLTPESIKGRMGWCAITQREGTKIKESTGKPYVNNHLSCYHTDREKFSREVEVDPFA